VKEKFLDNLTRKGLLSGGIAKARNTESHGPWRGAYGNPESWGTATMGISKEKKKKEIFERVVAFHKVPNRTQPVRFFIHYRTQTLVRKPHMVFFQTAWTVEASAPARE